MLIQTRNEITGIALEIVEKLKIIGSSEHDILIYPNLHSFREIYSNFCKIVLENCEIVLLFTYYETVDTVRQT